MAILTIEIPDTMLAFIDRRIASGDFKSRDEYIETLIALDMYTDDHPEPDCYLQGDKIVFASEEQRERFAQKVDEALDEVERGDVTPWKKGDCARMGREYLREKRDNANQGEQS